MINGFFYCDKAEPPSIAISVLGERCDISQQNKEFNLKQIFSKENLTGTLIGNHISRAILGIHLSVCHGMICPCHNLASHFLSHGGEGNLDDYIRDNQAYLTENVQFPYLMVLFQDSDFVVITSDDDKDFHSVRLDAGQYELRDCFLSISPDSAEPLCDNLQEWINQGSDGTEISNKLTRLLTQKLQHFPVPSQVDTQGLTLLKNDRKNCLHYSEHIAATTGKGPKGPINLYNFFSMESRKAIRETNGANERSNNDWNRLVAKRWKSLSPEEQEPFRRQAEADKQRYEEECNAAGVIAEKQVKQTAYNLFVHQEKQFVSGTGVSNIKEKTGKHCSARWKKMDIKEKQLYLAIEEANLPDYRGGAPVSSENG